MKNQVICKHCGEVSEKLSEKNINSKLSFAKVFSFLIKFNVIMFLSGALQAGAFMALPQLISMDWAMIFASVFSLFVSVFTIYLIAGMIYNIFPRCQHCSSRSLVTLKSPEGVRTMQLNKKAKSLQKKLQAKKEAEEVEEVLEEKVVEEPESEDKEEDKKEG